MTLDSGSLKKINKVGKPFTRDTKRENPNKAEQKRQWRLHNRHHRNSKDHQETF